MLTHVQAPHSLERRSTKQQEVFNNACQRTDVITGPSDGKRCLVMHKCELHSCSDFYEIRGVEGFRGDIVIHTVSMTSIAKCKKL